MNRAGKRIVSGGQTGVDRAALDAAASAGLDHGGWCPHGRGAEDGTISARYHLVETPLEAPSQRTEWNVRDSHATVILTLGAMDSGTQLTLRLAEDYQKPVRVIDLRSEERTALLSGILEHPDYPTVNFAGPRESSSPGIYRIAYEWLRCEFEL